MDMKELYKYDRGIASHPIADRYTELQDLLERIRPPRQKILLFPEQPEQPKPKRRRKKTDGPRAKVTDFQSYICAKNQAADDLEALKINGGMSREDALMDKIFQIQEDQDADRALKGLSRRVDAVIGQIEKIGVPEELYKYYRRLRVEYRREAIGLRYNSPWNRGEIVARAIAEEKLADVFKEMLARANAEDEQSE